MSDDKEQRPGGVAGIIWMLEHARDLVSLIVGVLLCRSFPGQVALMTP